MERTNKKIIVDGFKKITDYRIKKVEDNYIWVVTGSNFFDFGNECSVIDFDGNVLFDDIDELRDCTYIGNNIFKYGLFHYYNYYIVDNHKIKLLDGVKDIKKVDSVLYALSLGFKDSISYKVERGKNKGQIRYN